DGFVAGVGEGGDFFRGEVAFGADQPDGGGGEVAGVVGAPVGEHGFERAGSGVKAGDEAQGGVGRRAGGFAEEFGEGAHGADAGKEGGAALLGGFEGGDAPFVGFAVGAVGVEVDLGAGGQQRFDGGGAEFGGVAHDVVHDAALGQGLGEGDGGVGAGVAAGGLDAERGGAAVGVGEGAGPLGADAVEGDDGVAGAGAVDGDEVVRFLRRKAQFGDGGRRRGVKNAMVGHGAKRRRTDPCGHKKRSGLGNHSKAASSGKPTNLTNQLTAMRR